MKIHIVIQIILLTIEGSVAGSLEFCSESTTETIENNRLVKRGIIYSPNFPNTYNSIIRSGQPCNLTINGLYNSSWLRLEQNFVELYGYSSRRNFQPCIEEGFQIHNASLNKDVFNCPLREGAIFNQRSVTLSLYFAEREMPPFTIEYTVYPVIAIPFGSEQSISYDFSTMPEGYMSFTNDRVHYGNLTAKSFKSLHLDEILEDSDNIYLTMLIPNKTTVVDMDIRYKLGIHKQCYNTLNKTSRFPYRQRNDLNIKVNEKGYESGSSPSWFCNDADMYYFGPHRIIWNAEMLADISIYSSIYDWETAAELMIKFTIYSCNENIPHVKDIRHLDGAPFRPIYNVICDDGYYLVGDEKYLECMDGDWLPYPPVCSPINKVEVIDVKIKDSRSEIEVLIACNVIMFVLTLLVLFWKIHTYRKSTLPAAKYIPAPSTSDVNECLDVALVRRPSSRDPAAAAHSTPAIEYEEVDLELEVEINHYQEILRYRPQRPATN